MESIASIRNIFGNKKNNKMKKIRECILFVSA